MVVLFLGENIYPETVSFIQRVGKIARSLGHIIGEQAPIITNQVKREHLGLERSEFLDRRIDFHGNQYAVTLHLQRFVYRNV